MWMIGEQTRVRSLTGETRMATVLASAPNGGMFVRVHDMRRDVSRGTETPWDHDELIMPSIRSGWQRWEVIEEQQG